MTKHALAHHEHHEDTASKVIFGFWIYIMTDCILFASLFATYAVLHNNTYGGPGVQQMATLPFVLLQSLMLLASCFANGLSFVAVQKAAKNQVMFWLVVAFLLGLAFVGLEWQQFSGLIAAGNSWQKSAFLSAFFTLVGVHGLHVVVGLLWMLVLMIQLAMKNLTTTMKIRFTCLNIFLGFLNIMWVFIFTIVYLMGAIQHV
jgi:cytochrome o ubiquinol oxidase subunit 3